MEQEYLISQIEQGKKIVRAFRTERERLSKKIATAQKFSASKRDIRQLKMTQRNMDKLMDKVLYYEEQLNGKTARAISDLSQKAESRAAELKAVRQRRDELLAKKDEKFRKYKETRRKSILRGQIKSLVNDFNSRLDRPNQKHYLPEELVSAVIDLTSAINVENDSASAKIQERLEHMKAVYDRYENDKAV